MALLALGFWSCCDERPSKVSDMSGRLDLAFDWATKIDFDASMRFDFDGDFSSWAHFSAAAGIDLKFEFSASSAYKRRILADLDDDGVEEWVDLLAFASGDPASPERVVLSWRGDDYTFDADRCYVMWWEGNTLELLNGRCGSSEPALHCQMAKDKSSTLNCDVCTASGTCAACSAAAVSDCVSEGDRKLDPPGGFGGGSGMSGVAGSAGAATLAGAAGLSAGLSGAAGSAGYSAGQAGAGGTLESGASGHAAATSVGTSVSIEFDTCQAQVRSLSNTASSCNRTLRGASELCSTRLSDVNVCYVAVQAVGLFGSTCSAMGSDVCQGVRQ